MVEVKVVSVHQLYTWIQEERISFYLNNGYDLKGVDSGFAYFTRTQPDLEFPQNEKIEEE